MQDLTIPARVVYSKTGRARYISHLDTMRTLTRALRRSGLPLWYTQGFNPHLYMTFLLPLALGVESLCEIVDLRLTRQMDWDAVKEGVSAHLPPGFEIQSARGPILPAKCIAWAEYRLELDFPQGEREGAALAMKQLLESNCIMVSKKTKKGEQMVDIRPHLSLLDISAGERGFSCDLRLSAGTAANVSPRLVLEAFGQIARPPESVKILRTGVLDDKLEDFA